jgi:hypothetical protein
VVTKTLVSLKSQASDTPKSQASSQQDDLASSGAYLAGRRLSKDLVKIKNTFIDGFEDEKQDGDAMANVHELGVSTCPVMRFGGSRKPKGRDAFGSQGSEARMGSNQVPAMIPTAPMQVPVPYVTQQTGPSMTPMQAAQPMVVIPAMQSPSPMQVQAVGMPTTVGSSQVRVQPTTTGQQQQAQQVRVMAVPQAASQSIASPGLTPIDPLATRKPQTSVGATYHGTGTCKPCAWYWKPQGCANSTQCQHCHMCPEGELKNRKKAKVANLRSTVPGEEGE